MTELNEPPDLATDDAEDTKGHDRQRGDGDDTDDTDDTEGHGRRV
jgi:hypothetical protein